MKQTISFNTLGCRLNQSETAVIEKTFRTRGFTIVDFKEPAQIAVINTCTVTENGDADTRKLVNKLTRINPRVKIALIGCQAQIQKEALTKLPNVRWVVGNAKKMDLADILHYDEIKSEAEVIIPPFSRESFTMPTAGIDSRHTRANIKIQDGCDFFCSFCEIPYARGRARSRTFEDILLEAEALSKAGHQEIVVTGINVGTYAYKSYRFLDVLDALEDIQGLSRIRISSIEPTTIPTKLLDKINSSRKLCRYLHIPLQSASDEVLNVMKRKYTLKEYSDFIKLAKNKIKGLCIGTDIIVGFPAETKERFSFTLEKLKELPVDYFHVFSYSQRNMAQSRRFANGVNPTEIQQRSRILRELSLRKRKVFMNSLVGKKEKVLFEQKKKGVWSGLTDNFARVQVKSSEDLTNKLKTVRLTDCTEEFMIGEICEG